MLHGLAGQLTPTQSKHIQHFVYRTYHARQQLRNLIDYARLQTLPPDALTCFELHTLLKPKLVTIPYSTNLIWEIPLDLPPIYSSRLYVAQAVLNLVMNALEATKGGAVMLRASVHDDTIGITVTDTGNGISAQAFPHIHEPFFQGIPRPDHLGLGLTVAQEQIRLQGSALNIKSAESGGTRVSFNTQIFKP
jgi:signal transduction histidine kinase